MGRKKLPLQERIWTPEIAYAMGLLATDGNLSSDGRHVILRSVDEDQIKNFKECLGASQRIERTNEHRQQSGNRKPVYRIQIGDVGLYRWLQSIGFHPRKTFTLGSIPIPDEYFPDFLRGHLDGDGSVVAYKDCYNTTKDTAYVYQRFLICFLSASEYHIQWLQRTVYRLFEIRGRIHERPARAEKSTIWKLKFMKNESLKLFDFMYYAPDVTCLARKRTKAERAIKLIGKQKKKVYTLTGKFSAV